MELDLETLSTEKRNPRTMGLDTMSALEIVTEMNREDGRTVLAVKKALPEISRAAVLAAEAFRNGGRLLYMGAGTSGRLGVLDAAECPPTFGVPEGQVVGLIAGGREAMFRAREGAEDQEALGKEDLMSIGLQKEDFLLGIGASGRTPYVLGGLGYAGALGCHTGALVCTADSPMGKAAEFTIEVIPGPEVLTGSTRLKAGTCQKMVLNMISTAAMVLSGKVYENLMVDVMQTNEKLKIRARNMVMEVTGVSRDQAEQALFTAGGSVKIAITMILADCGREEAEARLFKAGGQVREAIL